MKSLDKLIENNKAWAKKISESNPEFFSNLSQQQTPEYLWIGCSDSRVSANQIVDSLPGELFVHRNIANVVAHTDLNILSVIQFAVEVLQVKHIIVCGHYGCGGIHAAMDKNTHGLIDNWLRHIKDVARHHNEELSALPNNQRHNRLCELNVIEQVFNVCNTTIVRNNWKNKNELTVHGWMYNMNNGIVKDLEISVSGLGDLEDYYRDII